MGRQEGVSFTYQLLEVDRLVSEDLPAITSDVPT